MAGNPKRPKLLKPVPPLPDGPWVCVEGHPVEAKDVQRGIGNKPLALCWTCRRGGSAGALEERVKAVTVKPFKSRLVPVMPIAEWHKRPKAVKPAVPMAMFTDAEAPEGELADDGRIVVAHRNPMAEHTRAGRARR